jgi:hypothetical protein
MYIFIEQHLMFHYICTLYNFFVCVASRMLAKCSSVVSYNPCVMFKSGKTYLSPFFMVQIFKNLSSRCVCVCVCVCVCSAGMEPRASHARQCSTTELHPQLLF